MTTVFPIRANDLLLEPTFIVVAAFIKSKFTKLSFKCRYTFAQVRLLARLVFHLIHLFELVGDSGLSMHATPSV